jgi:hypothetical protein
MKVDPRYERLRRYGLIGKWRGASRWIVISYAVTTTPIAVGLALKGYWWISTLVVIGLVAGVYQQILEYRAYSEEESEAAKPAHKERLRRPFRR